MALGYFFLWKQVKGAFEVIIYVLDKEEILNDLGEVNVGDWFVLTLEGNLNDKAPIEGLDCIDIVKSGSSDGGDGGGGGGGGWVISNAAYEFRMPKEKWILIFLLGSLVVCLLGFKKRHKK